MYSKRCTCENETDESRVKCLVNHFQILMEQRQQPIPREQLTKMLATQSLNSIELFSVVVDSATHEFAENQILFTFIKNYVKTHPQFLVDGPTNIGDLKLKSSFFQST